MTITRGFLTYDAEGNDDPDSPYFSRKLHVPSESSGATIGRGYDCKRHKVTTIKGDLVACGVSGPDADLFSELSGKLGEHAKALIEGDDFKGLTITIDQQEILFNLEYMRATSDVMRICSKPDCVVAYGVVVWHELHPAIQDLLVDLRYRGDYTAHHRRRMQKHIVSNDPEGLLYDICTRANWPDVPRDRFNRRFEFMEKAFEELEK